MEEHQPLLPRGVEDPGELVGVIDRDDVSRRRGRGVRRDRWRRRRGPASEQVEEALLDVLGESIEVLDQRVLFGVAHPIHPVCRHADGEQERDRGFGERREDDGLILIDGAGDDLLTLDDLDDLGLTGRRVLLDLVALRPGVRVVVVVDVAQDERVALVVHDGAHVAVDPEAPHVAVTRVLDAVELEARLARVDLEVERRALGLRGVLLVQILERAGE